MLSSRFYSIFDLLSFKNGNKIIFSSSDATLNVVFAFGEYLTKIMQESLSQSKVNLVSLVPTITLVVYYITIIPLKAYGTYRISIHLFPKFCSLYFQESTKTKGKPMVH